MGVVESGQGGARGPQRLCLLSSLKHWCVTESHHLFLSAPICKDNTKCWLLSKERTVCRAWASTHGPLWGGPARDVMKSETYFLF